MPSINITLATANYRLSLDTDYCFTIITDLRSRSFRRTTDQFMVNALAAVIPRLTPADDAIAAKLWADLSPMAERNQPRPAINASTDLTVSYPPTSQHAQPIDKADRHRNYYPQRLKAHSYECVAYRSADYHVH